MKRSRKNPDKGKEEATSRRFWDATFGRAIKILFTIIFIVGFFLFLKMLGSLDNSSQPQPKEWRIFNY